MSGVFFIFSKNTLKFGIGPNAKSVKNWSLGSVKIRKSPIHNWPLGLAFIQPEKYTKIVWAQNPIPYKKKYKKNKIQNTNFGEIDFGQILERHLGGKNSSEN